MFSACEQLDQGEVVRERGYPVGFPHKRGWLITNVAKKILCYHACLELFQDLFISCLKVLVGRKVKPLVGAENSSSVNV